MHVSAELCLAAIERRCQIPDCSITAMKYAHLLLSTGACLASLPLLSRFGVGADLICSLCCLPPWGRNRTCNSCGSLVQHRTVAIHCFLPSAFWKFRSQVQWLPHHDYSEPGCRVRQSSPSDKQGGPIMSLEDLPVSCALEPAKGSC